MKKKKPTEEEIQTTNSWGTWSKEPSKFKWSYDDKETCFILEGKARVIDNDGNVIEFSEGDWIEFEEGLNCTWEISETIRKKYKFGK